MTSIHAYDPTSATSKLTPLPMAGLIIAVWNLLDQACDLAEPVDITVYRVQSITLQFARKPSSVAAITRWAARFGAVLSSESHQTESGPQTWVRTEFDYYGIAVKAFAHIPA